MLLSRTTTMLLSRRVTLFRSAVVSPRPSPLAVLRVVAVLPRRERAGKCFTTVTTASKDEASNEIMNDMDLAQLKSKLMDRALQQVHNHGWTKEAIVVAASQLQDEQQNVKNISLSISGLIQPNDMIRYCMDRWNRQLREDLKDLKQTWQEQLQASAAESDNAALAPSRADRIVQALQRRLEYSLDYMQSKQWHAGMALGAHPDNVFTTKQQLQDMIDMIVDAAVTLDNGDESSNEDKQQPLVLSQPSRFALGAVFCVTELHMLADEQQRNATGLSPASYDFLRQRVQDWERIVTVYEGMVNGSPPSFSSLSGSSASDTLDVASIVASSFATGVFSLFGQQPPPPIMQSENKTTPSSSFSANNKNQDPLTDMLSRAPEHIWNALFDNNNLVTQPSHNSRSAKATADVSKMSTNPHSKMSSPDTSTSRASQ